jgi:hypothetical protein
MLNSSLSHSLLSSFLTPLAQQNLAESSTTVDTISGCHNVGSLTEGPGMLLVSLHITVPHCQIQLLLLLLLILHLSFQLPIFAVHQPNRTFPLMASILGQSPALIICRLYQIGQRLLPVQLTATGGRVERNTLVREKK